LPCPSDVLRDAAGDEGRSGFAGRLIAGVRGRAREEDLRPIADRIPPSAGMQQIALALSLAAIDPRRLNTVFTATVR
jgi:hypothetical protein